jgi:hypothetical protein
MSERLSVPERARTAKEMPLLSFPIATKPTTREFPSSADTESDLSLFSKLEAIAKQFLTS